ncbi:MAG: arginine--tRNA ligase, partial [Halobacteria archaeon]|nr:arginine--tRNA ligase [Halobacteria archaeon]
MLTQFRTQVEDALSKALSSAGYETDDLSIEKPPDDVEAEFASAVAFELAGREDENPAKVAPDIAAEMKIGD